VQVESRSRFARFCAGNAANFSIWDEMGSLVIHEQLDAGKREQPGATNEGDQPVVVSDAIIEGDLRGHQHDAATWALAHSLKFSTRNIRSQSR
jgi:hypothetical protein